MTITVGVIAVIVGMRLALSAFSSYFAVKYHTDATFNADNGVSHERTAVKSPLGDSIDVDLWTGCYTPRELRLMCAANNLRVDAITSVEPGNYRDEPATTESPEFLLLATKS